MIKFHTVVKTWSGKNDINNLMRRELDQLGQEGYRLVSITERLDHSNQLVYCRVWLEKCYMEEETNE
jgi:hypothetical protein